MTQVIQEPPKAPPPWRTWLLRAALVVAGLFMLFVVLFTLAIGAAIGGFSKAKRDSSQFSYPSGPSYVTVNVPVAVESCNVQDLKVAVVGSVENPTEDSHDYDVVWNYGTKNSHGSWTLWLQDQVATATAGPHERVQWTDAAGPDRSYPLLPNGKFPRGGMCEVPRVKTWSSPH